jgi:hypothetical protein
MYPRSNSQPLKKFLNLETAEVGLNLMTFKITSLEKIRVIFIAGAGGDWDTGVLGGSNFQKSSGRKSLRIS